jgi:hypothetical protein
MPRTRVYGVRQTEVHTAEPSVPELSPFEVENATLIQVGGKTLHSEIH